MFLLEKFSKPYISRNVERIFKHRTGFKLGDLGASFPHKFLGVLMAMKPD